MYDSYHLVLSIFVGVLIYIIPWIVALCRRVQRAWLILLVTLLTGWTLLGWVVCIVWACMGRTMVDQAYVHYDTGWQPNQKSSLFRPDPAKVSAARQTWC
jgi:hypothetical protein